MTPDITRDSRFIHDTTEDSRDSKAPHEGTGNTRISQTLQETAGVPDNKGDGKRTVREINMIYIKFCQQIKNSLYRCLVSNKN